jgi:hypothetical protein
MNAPTRERLVNSQVTFDWVGLVVERVARVSPWFVLEEEAEPFEFLKKQVAFLRSTAV